jgi:hypothetical protein
MFFWLEFESAAELFISAKELKSCIIYLKELPVRVPVDA